jgi:hypothetical protein
VSFGVLERMKAAVPPYLATEQFVVQAFGAFANELERANVTAEAIRDGLIPSLATDTYKGLSMLEAQLGLPIAPAGYTDDQRRALILAWIKARSGGTGAAWVALMTLAFGGNPWSYQEGPTNFEVTVNIPFGSGTLTAQQALVLTRAITPAHLDVIASYGTGFLLGVSDIGVQPI